MSRWRPRTFRPPLRAERSNVHILRPSPYCSRPMDYTHSPTPSSSQVPLRRSNAAIPRRPLPVPVPLVLVDAPHAPQCSPPPPWANLKNQRSPRPLPPTPLRTPYFPTHARKSSEDSTASRNSHGSTSSEDSHASGSTLETHGSETSVTTVESTPCAVAGPSKYPSSDRESFNLPNPYPSPERPLPVKAATTPSPAVASFRLRKPYPTLPTCPPPPPPRRPVLRIDTSNLELRTRKVRPRPPPVDVSKTMASRSAVQPGHGALAPAHSRTTHAPAPAIVISPDPAENNARRARRTPPHARALEPSDKQVSVRAWLKGLRGKAAPVPDQRVEDRDPVIPVFRTRPVPHREQSNDWRGTVVTPPTLTYKPLDLVAEVWGEVERRLEKTCVFKSCREAREDADNCKCRTTKNPR